MVLYLFLTGFIVVIMLNTMLKLMSYKLFIFELYANDKNKNSKLYFNNHYFIVVL